MSRVGGGGERDTLLIIETERLSLNTRYDCRRLEMETCSFESTDMQNEAKKTYLHKVFL